jgi:hypothetical protein
MGHWPSSVWTFACAPVGPLKGVGVGVGVGALWLGEQETDWRAKSATKMGKSRREFAAVRLT